MTVLHANPFSGEIPLTSLCQSRSHCWPHRSSFLFSVDDLLSLSIVWRSRSQQHSDWLRACRHRTTHVCRSSLRQRHHRQHLLKKVAVCCRSNRPDIDATSAAWRWRHWWVALLPWSVDRHTSTSPAAQVMLFMSSELHPTQGFVRSLSMGLDVATKHLIHYNHVHHTIV